jgi:glutaredoxin-like YruB-family protein
MNKLLLGFWICVAVVAWVSLHAEPPPPRAVSPAAVAASVAGKPGNAALKIQMYTTDWCGVCKRAKRYMNQHGIAYTEYDVEKDAARAEEFRLLGGRGVPLILVGSQVMHGFNQEELEQLRAAK